MNEKMILVEQEKIDTILLMLEGLRQAQENKGGIVSLKLYNSTEAADILGVSESTLKNLRRQGRIEFIQDGKVVRYTYDQLKDYQEEKTFKTFKKSSYGKI